MYQCHCPFALIKSTASLNFLYLGQHNRYPQHAVQEYYGYLFQSSSNCCNMCILISRREMPMLSIIKTRARQIIAEFWESQTHCKQFFSRSMCACQFHEAKTTSFTRCPVYVHAIISSSASTAACKKQLPFLWISQFRNLLAVPLTELLCQTGYLGYLRICIQYFSKILWTWSWT